MHAARGLLLGYVPWCHVIDVKRVYLTPFIAHAVVSRFYNNGNVSVHLWNATSRPYDYMQMQETQLETPRATGRLEVVSQLTENVPTSRLHRDSPQVVAIYSL